MIIRRKLYSEEGKTVVVSGEEYSHLRALADKEPSVKVSEAQEAYEKEEIAIKDKQREELLEAKDKGEVNSEAKAEKEGNLEHRDASIDTLNSWLAGC